MNRPKYDLEELKRAMAAWVKEHGQPPNSLEELDAAERAMRKILFGREDIFWCDEHGLMFPQADGRVICDRCSPEPQNAR